MSDTYVSVYLDPNDSSPVELFVSYDYYERRRGESDSSGVIIAYIELGGDDITDRLSEDVLEEICEMIKEQYE